MSNETEQPAVLGPVQRGVRPRAWYSPAVDDCITDERKTKRAKGQPWDAEHYSVPLFELHTPVSYECEDCIGMKEHGCYCQAMGARKPGGPAA